MADDAIGVDVRPDAPTDSTDPTDPTGLTEHDEGATITVRPTPRRAP
jgi:hypothetical protein